MSVVKVWANGDDAAATDLNRWESAPATLSRQSHAPGLNLWFPEAEGAVGDGQTDDSQAWLNAAIAAGGKGTVQGVPGVTYGIGTQTNFPAGTAIAQASFKMVGAARAIGMRFAGLTVIDQVDFDFQQSAGTPNSTSYGLQVQAAAAGSKIQFCTFTNSDGPTLTSTGIKVEGQVDIIGCEFSNISQPIQVTGSTDGVNILTCAFRDWTQRAIYVLGTSGAASNLTIQGCRIYPHNALAGSAQPRQPVAFQGVDASPFVNVTIDNNLVVGAGTSHDPTADQLAAGTQWGSADLISLHNCIGFKITRNTCTDGGDVGITIALECRNGVVSENVCLRNDSAGISAGSTSGWISDIEITSNVLMDNGQNRASDGPAYANCGLNIMHARRVVTGGNRCGDSFPTNWTATTPYNDDDQVAVGTAVLVCVVAGTSGSTAPTAPSTVGDTVTDGGVTWELVFALQTKKTQQYGISVQNSANVQLGDDQLFGNATAPLLLATNTGPVTVPNSDLDATLTADFTVTNLADLTDASQALTTTGLMVAVLAGTYDMTAYLIYNSSSTADAKIKLIAPGSTVINWTQNAPIVNTAASNTQITRSSLTIGSEAGMGGTGTDLVALPVGRVTFTQAGTFLIRFAQNTADPSNTILRAGSWLHLARRN